MGVWTVYGWLVVPKSGYRLDRRIREGDFFNSRAEAYAEKEEYEKVVKARKRVDVYCWNN